MNVFCQKLATYGKTTSHAGTLTRVARVRAEYPNQLDYMGYQEFGAK